jgi:hypothetical protein
MYKFYGKSRQVVNSTETGQFVFAFNTKGEFITDDESIIKRAIEKFDYSEIKVESIGDMVKVRKKPSSIKIEVKEG